MELRFGLVDGVEQTQKEVADALGISQSYISRLEKRIIRQLKGNSWGNRQAPAPPKMERMPSESCPLRLLTKAPLWESWLASSGETEAV